MGGISVGRLVGEIMAYYTTTVNTDIDVDIDLDEIFEDLSEDELIQLVKEKGYVLYKHVDAEVDTHQLADRIILKMKSKADYKKDLDDLLYSLTGRYV